jgi:hypothetical protein
VSDQFDVAVHDAEALAEIELLTNVIIATSEHEGPLPEKRIDEILGITPPPEPSDQPGQPDQPGQAGQADKPPEAPRAEG